MRNPSFRKKVNKIQTKKLQLVEEAPGEWVESTKKITPLLNLKIVNKSPRRILKPFKTVSVGKVTGVGDSVGFGGDVS